MKRIITYLLCLLLSIFVSAQVTFEATVSKTTATTSDRLEVSFTLNNGGKASGFKPPSFSDFKVLGGPNQSSSYSSINGKTTQSFAYKYVLQPKSTGTFTIGSATIQSGGNTYTTRPISITVTQKSAAEKEEEQDLAAFLRNNFYLRAEVSDAEIYKGEEIFVTYYLYVNSKSDIMDFRVNGATKVPAFDGFYAEEIDVSHIQGEYKNISGQQFLVQPIKKVRLTAQRPGDLLANPLTIDGTVSVRNKKRSGGDPFFDDFFGRGYERYNATATSPAVKIKVKDLPSNAPDSFNGAVGSFDMKTSINTTETATDEPLTYRIELKGKGNITLFNAPELELPPGWETYEPKVSGGKDSRTYEYLLIPRNPGTFELPAHEWSYFDPSEQQYFTLSSEAYQIVVSEGENYKGTQTIAGKEDVEQLAKDIQFITRDTPRFARNKGVQVQSPLFAIGMGTPFIAGLLLIVFTARKRKQFNPQLERNKQAGTVAKKRLQVAGELVAANNTTAFYNEGIRVVWGYLGDKFNIPQSMLNKEHIASVLQEKGMDAEVVNNTMLLLQQLEMGLYAPTLAGSGLQVQYDKIEAWIMQIEKAGVA